MLETPHNFDSFISIQPQSRVDYIVLGESSFNGSPGLFSYQHKFNLNESIFLRKSLQSTSFKSAAYHIAFMHQHLINQKTSVNRICTTVLGKQGYENIFKHRPRDVIYDVTGMSSRMSNDVTEIPAMFNYVTEMPRMSNGVREELCITVMTIQ